MRVLGSNRPRRERALILLLCALLTWGVYSNHKAGAATTPVQTLCLFPEANGVQYDIVGVNMTESGCAAFGGLVYSGLLGPTGPPGPTGPVGPQGGTGPTGAQGVQGPQGVQGVKGDVGTQGPQGNQGNQGFTGPRGAQGEAGPRGAAGQDAPPPLTIASVVTVTRHSSGFDCNPKGCGKGLPRLGTWVLFTSTITTTYTSGAVRVTHHTQRVSKHDDGVWRTVDRYTP